MTGFLEEITEGTSLTVGEIITRLRETYCSTIGVVSTNIKYLNIEKKLNHHHVGIYAYP